MTFAFNPFTAEPGWRVLSPPQRLRERERGPGERERMIKEGARGIMGRGKKAKRSPRAHHSLPQSSNRFSSLAFSSPTLKTPGDLCGGENVCYPISSFCMPDFPLTAETWANFRDGASKSFIFLAKMSILYRNFWPNCNDKLPVGDWPCIVDDKIELRQISSGQRKSKFCRSFWSDSNYFTRWLCLLL